MLAADMLFSFDRLWCIHSLMAIKRDLNATFLCVLMMANIVQTPCTTCDHFIYPSRNIIIFHVYKRAKQNMYLVVVLVASRFYFYCLMAHQLNFECIAHK